jgi:hypothetical protein
MSFASGIYSVTLGGGALLAGGRATATVTVPGARSGMHVVMTPQSDMGAGVMYGAWVSANDTVTAFVGAIIALTPVSVTYNISVWS